MKNLINAANSATSSSKELDSLIKEMDKHLNELESIALVCNSERLDKYLSSNDFMFSSFIGVNFGTPCSFVILRKDCSDGKYIYISTYNNTMYAISNNSVVYEKKISSSLAIGINANRCLSINIDPLAKQIASLNSLFDMED